MTAISLVTVSEDQIHPKSNLIDGRYYSKDAMLSKDDYDEIYDIIKNSKLNSKSPCKESDIRGLFNDSTSDTRKFMFLCLCLRINGEQMFVKSDMYGVTSIKLKVDII